MVSTFDTIVPSAATSLSRCPDIWIGNMARKLGVAHEQM